MTTYPEWLNETTTAMADRAFDATANVAARRDYRGEVISTEDFLGSALGKRTLPFRAPERVLFQHKRAKAAARPLTPPSRVRDRQGRCPIGAEWDETDGTDVVGRRVPCRGNTARERAVVISAESLLCSAGDAVLRTIARAHEPGALPLRGDLHARVGLSVTRLLTNSMTSNHIARRWLRCKICDKTRSVNRVRVSRAAGAKGGEYEQRCHDRPTGVLSPYHSVV